MKMVFKYALIAFFAISAGYAEDYSVARIGLGGVYTLQQPSGEKDITNTGGYLALWSRGTLANERFLVQSGGEIGFGKAKRDGVQNDMFYMGDVRISAGVNLFTPSTPLYLSIGYAWDNFDSKLLGNQLTGKDNKGNSWVNNTLHLVGLDLSGVIKGKSANLEYDIGYYYAFHGYYYLDETRSGIDDYTYAVKARVGIASDYSKKIGFFANLRAKYYDIPTSKMNTTFSRPATKHFIAGVEAGIQF